MSAERLLQPRYRGEANYALRLPAANSSSHDWLIVLPETEEEVVKIVITILVLSAFVFGIATDAMARSSSRSSSESRPRIGHHSGMNGPSKAGWGGGGGYHQ
jgi:hypothetical protein